MSGDELRIVDVAAENREVRNRFFARLEAIYDAADFTAGYARGPVEQLEELLRERVGRRFALGVGAGTHALHMAAHALGLGPDDEVVVPANTFVSSATAPAMTGAKVVACDVDPDTLNLTRETVDAVRTERTRAVVAVSMYGAPFPYDELRSLDLPLIEDAAHSQGAVYRGIPSGRLGDYSVFSFFPSKVGGGIGDSGALLFDDDDRVDELRAFRNCGQAKPHYATVLGNVYRMHVVQAAFLLEKLAVLDRLVAHRRRIAAVYDERLRGTPVRPQLVQEGSSSAYFAYVVRVPGRDAVGERLRSRGIPWTVQYRYLLHEQPVWAAVSARRTDVPEATRAAREIMSLPIHAGITEEQAASVADALLAALD